MSAPTQSRPQPVLAAAVVALVTAITGTLVAFGLPITPEQTAAVVGLVNALSTVLGVYLAWRASQKVTPTASPMVRDSAGALVPLLPYYAPGTGAGGASSADLR